MKLEELKLAAEIGELHGLYPNISDTVYHHPECPGRSSSFFKTLLTQTPKHAMAKLQENEETAALIFGRAAHLLVQDPIEFEKRFTFAPEGMIRNEKHAKYQEFLAANAGKTVLSLDEWKTLQGIQGTFANHPLTKLMQGAQIESSGFWTDPETGVLCKIRPDFYVDGVVYDLKTSSNSIDPFTFEKTIHQYGYYISAAMYLEGMSAILGEKLKRFVLIAAEKKAPYEIVFYDLTDGAIEKGQEEFRRAIKTYAECEQTGVFPGYDRNFVPAALPSYAF